MEAATTYAGGARARPVRAQRRRRLMLGAGVAIAAIVALGVAFAGASDPSLHDRINAARSDAGQLSDKVASQTAQIGSLTDQAHRAGAQAMELNAQVEDAQVRSDQLAKHLNTAEHQLDQLRGQYAVAVKQLDRRLVEIYESDVPDFVTVMLDSNGFDDLSTRTAYLNALHDADMRVADRVASVRDQMAQHTHQVADLKQQADSEAQQLSADKASFLASQHAANQSAAAVAAARSGTQAQLSEAQGQVAQLEQQLADQQASSTGAPAYLGGPYAIPTYIVICESGGNYHALNPSSGAGGAYQILPSTWRAYGGQGAPQNAPKAEQDRIAAEIWRDSGPSAWSCA